MRSLSRSLDTRPVDRLWTDVGGRSSYCDLIGCIQRSALVNRVLCKACQWLAKVYERTSVWPAICSFVHLSIYPPHSFVRCCFHVSVNRALADISGATAKFSLSHLAIPTQCPTPSARCTAVLFLCLYFIAPQLPMDWLLISSWRNSTTSITTA